MVKRTVTRKVTTTLGTMLDDVLSVWSVPTGTATLILQSIFRRRIEIADDIFRDEVRHGEKTLDAEEAEHAVTEVYHYFRASHEGAARTNLRSMAQVIAGQARQGRLNADEFLPYVSILTSLREPEIVLLGTYYRHWMSAAARAHSDPDERAQETYRLSGTELIPSLYPDWGEFASGLFALVRTGFFRTIGMVNGDIQAPTRFFLTLCEVSPFESAPPPPGC